MKNNSVLANKLVGEIPKDWSYINFKDVYGKPIRDFGSFSTTKLITFLDDGIPFLKSEMIKEGSIDWTNTYYISEKVHKLLNKSYVEKDTILFSKIGSALGKAVVYDGEKGVCNSNAAIAKITLNEKIADKYYYTYILNNSLAKKQFLRLIVSLLPRINLGDISDLLLPLPPLPEQQKIAKILTTWDKAIDTTERLIDNSKQQKKALMQQLLTGKKRLLDENGKRFEGEWEKVKLKECAISLDNKRVPLNSTERQSMQGNIPYWGANGIQGYIDKYIFDEPIVLLAEDGGNFNEFSTRPIANISYGKAWVNNHAHVLKAKSNTITEWLYYSLVHKNILAFVNGGTRAKLNKGDMLLIPILLPPLEEQQKIAAVLTNADKEIELLEQQLADLQQEKKALMQVLLTGKKRVRIDEIV
ncbi:restriction endonuclease subunit S [Psychrobacter celer]|uniref:restriction endonuclease subunit S n=1 Tax=Psychrobacter celer TaxID=306572 RepID=UPI003FD3CB40